MPQDITGAFSADFLPFNKSVLCNGFSSFLLSSLFLFFSDVIDGVTDAQVTNVHVANVVIIVVFGSTAVIGPGSNAVIKNEL